MLADDTTLHTSGKSVVQNQKMLQLCFDRILVWYNINHMLINPVKTKSMIITTRQKHQLSNLSLRLSLDGQNIENVTEHHLLGLIVNNKFRWQAQIEHICKSMLKKLFLLSQLQHTISIDSRKLFYNAHIKPHIDYASVVWDGCGEVCLKKMNSLHQRAGKLILPDPSLSTEQKMRALGILNLLQQLTYNKGIFMHKVLNNNSPNYLAQLFISRQSHYTNSRNNLYMPRPGLDLLKKLHILCWSVPLKI